MTSGMCVVKVKVSVSDAQFDRIDAVRWFVTLARFLFSS